MNDFLLTLLSLSISGGILALLYFLLKPLLKKRLSKTWQYYLWLLVAARLLLPFTPEVSVMGNLFRQIPAHSTGQYHVGAPHSGTNTTIGSGIENNAPAESPSAPSDRFQMEGGTSTQPGTGGNLAGNAGTAPGSSAGSTGMTLTVVFRWLSSNLWLIWAIVTAGLLLKKVTSYRSFIRFVKAGRQEVTDLETMDLYFTAAEEMHVRRLPKLYTHPVIGTPIQVGVIHPFIVLPEQMKDEGLLYVLRHELVHCRRMEFLYKWLIQLTLCLHWFNPLVYLAAREVDRACELACDEAVLRSLDGTERKSYGDVLLYAAEHAGNYSGEVISVTLCENGKNLKERLAAILDFQKNGKYRRIFGIAMTVCLCLGAGMLGGYTAAQVTLNRIAVPTSVGAGELLATEKPVGMAGNGIVNESIGEDLSGLWNDHMGGMHDWGYDYDWEEQEKRMRTVLEQSYSLTDVDTISLDITTADVVFYNGTGKDLQVVVNASADLSSESLPQIAKQGKELQIVFHNRAVPTAYDEGSWSGVSAEVLIYLPESYRNTLKLKGNASDFMMETNLNLEFLTLDCNASDAEFKSLQVKDCDLVLNASDLTVNRLTGAGKVRGNASDVELDAVTLTGKLDLSNNAGSMEVAMEKDAAFRFEGRWTLGEIVTYFPMERSDENNGYAQQGNATATVNGGGMLLSVHSACAETEIIMQSSHHN